MIAQRKTEVSARFYSLAILVYLFVVLSVLYIKFMQFASAAV